MTTSAIIYHNPRCNTSRTVLKAIQEAGIEPTVVKYLETPPTTDGLRTLLDDAGLTPSQAIRTKEAVYKELGLADASDDELIAAMVDHPILIERPIVKTDKGTVLARPADKVQDVL
ncbi:arsenate reductase (glutaredoxin) [Rhodococcus sp. BP-252]|uniref:arsenate reductase (glutaredoxin) n=1 Tax=unclassified Rhodococcus (in: high G+C Gram-positive bacteria) TaxID=192944 RepID=UPI001C9B70F6|nr:MULTISPECIES: arsenate reductase (glutaredoxin) [unclassified Rhodococcus (in: high G+C Gram-positive bacteria)]MBY6414600.1 arsenate reductase (glutaredoxin) [Rhodococcus sp. BP-320]MBY6419357.1 arsenate reductase (glutaredoxin) [Rhodococcus sp. BP-321]MBY6424339.1 arsenate reductase (glutaredoxin) [Rhodococcus sp. BP-324]MBY6429436.1 arsenate reductase (glutaredoxin) [Rhodococcus sp. BP-323]MBY6431955.1 arsenate reductase (glutaredoxin) [Rhodococcus sp. BP-322]